jgi:RNA polymerase sigma-70 factor (ECF subfamily)
VDTAICEIEAKETPIDIEEVFRNHYRRVARVIDRVVRDHGRAEELAVEVFLKLWKQRWAASGVTEAWLYRTAVRKALDELRRRNRKSRYESMLGLGRPKTPEDLTAESQVRERVQCVLSAIERRQAELLVLRSDGLSYGELAATLGINPASVGTLLSRAQEAFRKRYVRVYGDR